VRDLNLPKGSSELIRSKLHQNNLLTPGTAFPFTNEETKFQFRTYIMKHNIQEHGMNQSCPHLALTLVVWKMCKTSK